MATEMLYPATCLYLDLGSEGQGAIALCGVSGSGKSDLAYRMIEKGALLVSDDQTQLCLKHGQLIADSAPHIAGCLEVRGVGIVKMPTIKSVPLKLHVNLQDKPSLIERLPENGMEDILGCQIPTVDLYPFEDSAPLKLQLIFKTVFNPALLVD